MGDRERWCASASRAWPEGPVSVVRRARADRDVARCGRVGAGDRRATGSEPVHDQPGAAAQPRAGRRVPGQFGARDGLPPGVAAQAGEVGGEPGTAREGRAGSGEEVLTGADHRPPARGVPRRPGDAGVTRDHLPVDLRAVARRFAP